MVGPQKHSDNPCSCIDGKGHVNGEEHKTEWVTSIQPNAKFQLDFQILLISTLVSLGYITAFRDYDLVLEKTPLTYREIPMIFPTAMSRSHTVRQIRSCLDLFRSCFSVA